MAATAHTEKGCLFILSAPSGTGKSTLCKRILSRFPDMRYSVSYTTRPPRTGETEGADYHFISREEFERRIREGRWAEWAEVHGNYYGTSADLLEADLTAGHDILLDIDVNGARQIREKFPESVAVFIMPPSMEVLRHRLEKRSSDPPEVIAGRLKAAEEEIACSSEYTHVIINDELETAAAELIELIESYRDAGKRLHT
ncbi:MAG: guanylate kinase [Desulfobacterales bacterium]|nr:guanylate kinase [Desulfobacterales bacterium]MBS3755564.1 guanylate kinase [Desulfobacterales bacterium]